MSKAINKLKELYLFSSISLNPNYPKDRIGEPIFNTKSVPALVKCIGSYIELKGFELNHNKKDRFNYGVSFIDNGLIRAVFKNKALYILVKYQDKTKDDYEIKLENDIKDCSAYFFLATVTNSKSFDDFVTWFDNEIIGEEV